MTSLRQALTCAALAALTAFLIALTAATIVVAQLAQQLPKQLDAAIVESRGQILGQFADAQFQILKRVDQIAVKADSRIGSIQADVTQQLARTVDAANGQLTGTLSRVDAALTEVRGLREDARPILENAAGVTAHANEAAAILFARNALPAQILGVLGATKVTMGEAALAMRVVKDSAPAIAASTIDTADSVRGVAADVHVVTSAYVKPVGFWRKVWAGFKTAGVLYVRTL